MLHAARLAVFLALALPTLATAQAAPTTQPQREIVAEVLGQPVYRDELPQPPQPLNRINEYSSAISQRVLAPLQQAYQAEHATELTPTQEEMDRAAVYFYREHTRQLDEQRAERKERLREVEATLADENLDSKERERLQLTQANLESQTLPREALVEKVAALDEQLKSDLSDSRARRMLSARRDILAFELEHRGKLLAKMVLPGWKFQRHLYDHFGGGRILWQQAGTEAFDAMKAWIESEEKAGRLKFHDPHVREAVYLYWNVNHGAFLSDNPKDIDAFLNPPWLGEPAPTTQAAPTP